MSKIIKFQSKINLPCIINRDDQNLRLYFDNTIKFDTGADITIIPADLILVDDLALSEFTRMLQSHSKIVSLKKRNGEQVRVDNSLFVFSSNGAVVSDDVSPIFSYVIQVDSFDIQMDNGIIHLGSVPITITFDKRFKNPLLGRDILSLLNITINHDCNHLELEHTKFLGNAIANDNPVSGIYIQTNGYYAKDNGPVDRELIRKLLNRHSELSTLFNGTMDYYEGLGKSPDTTNKAQEIHAQWK